VAGKAGSLERVVVNWREEVREVAWLVLIVGGLSIAAVSLAVAVAVV
jgi:hypothetical protein